MTRPTERKTRPAGVAMDRRSLLVLGGGVALVGLVGLSPSPAAAAAPPAIRYAISDRRLPESHAFAAALVARGATRLEVTDGLTELWQAHLLPHWRGGYGAVAGLTSSSIWLGLAEQARSEARRSALIGRHDLLPDSGTATHVVTAPRAALAVGRPLARSGDWPLAMAALVGRCSSTGLVCDAEWRSPGNPSTVPAAPALASWIIV